MSGRALRKCHLTVAILLSQISEQVTKLEERSFGLYQSAKNAASLSNISRQNLNTKYAAGWVEETKAYIKFI